MPDGSAARRDGFPPIRGTAGSARASAQACRRRRPVACRLDGDHTVIPAL